LAPDRILARKALEETQSAAARAVPCHHERYDGAGYPAGLSGDAIPLVARILSIIDAYSAMIIDRPYHKGVSSEAARLELRTHAGTQFDPHLVGRFESLIVTLGPEGRPR
jgi:HD-GYP domain-containing protein (c-di-GMP phosphodiesterase class II)